MYIKEEDFGYFETLCKSLGEGRRERFMEILLKAGRKRTGEERGKINIVDDSIFDRRGIEPHEFITRTMIKKAFKEAKEG